jgi:PAS domain S-box-containing protein
MTANTTLSTALQPLDLPSLSLAITEHAPLPMATLDGATHIVRYANPAFCRLMDRSLEQIIGKPLEELLPDKDHCVTLLERVLRTKKPASHTELDPAKPHPVFWSYTIWPVQEDKGLVGLMMQVTETADIHDKTVAMNEALLLGSLRQHELAEAAENLNEQLRTEIAERKLAEQRIRESEERYRSLFISMDEGYCIIEMILDAHDRAIDYRFLDTNPSFEKQCGLHDVIGKRIREVLPNIEEHWFETFGKVALMGEPVRFINEAKSMGGRWFDLYAFRVGGQDGRKVAVLFKDITERKNTERELMEKARLLDLTDDAIIMRDMDYRICYWNHGAEMLFGWSRDEALGKEMHSFLQTEFPLPVAQITEELHRHDRWVGELMLTTRDGRRVTVLARKALDRDSQQNSAMVLETLTDITERKQIESHLKAAMAAAEKANLAKSDFLSSMSHELRSPLNAILGFAQLLESDATPQSASQKESTQHILHAGWYLLDLINEILDLALIESGKLLLSQEPLSLGEVVLECREMIQPQAQKKNIDVSYPEIESPAFVLADRTRVKQILLNLLSNAIKYNKVDGSVVVECAAASPERIRISVRDTGEGLPPEKMAQLFQPFNRLGKEASGEEGTGIGLVMTKRLVELMGGAIGVESTVGVGSVFWFELARAEAPHVVGTSSASSDYVLRDVAPRTLLCVEDNPANLKLIEQLVARRPNTYLLRAADASLGIELAREHLPEAILMDINLPGISGIDALKILREDPLTKHIPVIAVSANALPQDIERGLAAGFIRYLTKPIRVSEFMAALDAALEFSRTAIKRTLNERGAS